MAAFRKRNAAFFFQRTGPSCSNLLHRKDKSCFPSHGMGAHYISIQVRSDDPLAVKAAVEGVALNAGKNFLSLPH
jgi:hypothetical protein